LLCIIAAITLFIKYTCLMEERLATLRSERNAYKALYFDYRDSTRYYKELFEEDEAMNETLTNILILREVK